MGRKAARQADTFGSHPPASRDRAEGKAEMSRRLNNVKWMRAEDDKLRAAAASGDSVAAISKRLCRSESGVRCRAERIGIKLPSRQRFGFLKSPVEPGLKVNK